VKYIVAYFLLLVLITGLPIVVFTAPWGIDWAYWMQVDVMAWNAGWIFAAALLLLVLTRLTKRTPTPQTSS
jgi:hypothetical protein